MASASDDKRRVHLKQTNLLSNLIPQKHRERGKDMKSEMTEQGRGREREVANHCFGLVPSQDADANVSSLSEGRGGEKRDLDYL
jgi:hypothetical protein